jgi:hypothetical protein
MRRFSGELERGDALVARAEAAERSQGETEPWLFAARGTIAMFRGDFAESQAQGRAWVGWARGTGDPYDIAHALGLLGSALRSDPGQDLPVLEETVAVARGAGIASILALGLMMLGYSLPPDESDRALALLAEAADIATALGDRYGAANVLNMRNKVALDAGDLSNALATSAVVAEEMLEIGQKTGFGAAFAGAAFACLGLRAFEPAAVLYGYVETRRDLAPSNIERQTFDENQTIIDAALGRKRADELRARGAAMQPAEIVAYLRAESERVLSPQA